MKLTCSKCKSDHCWETNMDGTNGCCLCYNVQMLEEENDIISLCDGCYEYAKYGSETNGVAA